ncbi:hypothetical protein, partial [Collinsella aerofaciens]|uniref:hypothetical protein n=1 Tax=Collinsella aerofaciens TaxID=74426 RepID=UPI00232C9AA2
MKRVMPASIRKYAAKSEPYERTWLLRLVYQAFCCEKTGCARRFQNLPHTSENQVDLVLAKTIYQPCVRCGFATGRTLLDRVGNVGVSAPTADRQTQAAPVLESG